MKVVLPIGLNFVYAYFERGSIRHMQNSEPKKSRGRPKQFERRVLLAADDTLISAVESAAERESDKPSRSEMIRRIVTDWLSSKGYLPKA